MATTLTVSEILSDLLESFKKRVPALNFFATDFSNERATYGQTVISHIPTLPTAYAHVAATGYRNNAQNARDLLTDVPIVMNQWTDVPIKLLHDDVNEDRSRNYLKTIGNAGYVLGKTVCDFALGKVVEANFSEYTTEAIANWGKHTLGKARKAMNLKGAGDQRYCLVNSEVASALDEDPRITSGDYYNQRTEQSPMLHLKNVAGFSDVLEYADFPSNSENLDAFAFDSRAVAIATRLPKDSADLARQLGIPVTFKVDEIQDSETGLAIVAFSEIDQITHNITITASVMYGAVAGSQGGSAGALTDYAGHRIEH